MSEQRWWQTSSVYEIYPRSFADSNGDGVGDLEGIRHRLEYLSWLGVDAVWIAPFYRSPMADYGYDVADHTDVDPLFGSLADFDRLLTDAHARGLRVIVDYVPNHTSDRHRGSLPHAPPAPIRIAIGTPGAIPAPAAGPPTTGSACSAGQRGSGTSRPASSTCTRSFASSRI